MLIEKGSTGPEVYALQLILNKRDSTLHPDGIFNGRTEALLRQIQREMYVTGNIHTEDLDKLREYLGVSTPVNKVDSLLQMYANVPPTFSSDRNKTEIKYIVIHNSKAPDLHETCNVWAEGDLPLSCHVIIDVDGTIVTSVPTNRAAWHSGNLTKPKLDYSSLAIVLVNWGKLRKVNGITYHFTENFQYSQEIWGKPEKDEYGEWYMPYTKEQYEAVVSICKVFKSEFPIEDILVAERLTPLAKGSEGIFPIDKLKKELNFKNE